MNDEQTRTTDETATPVPGSINAYFLKHHTKGLERLAEAAGTKLSYLLQLNYGDRTAKQPKIPSLDMANRLIEASGGELTFEGLVNPKKVLVREAREALAG